VARERGDDSRWRRRHGQLGDRPLVLVTGHRRENFGPRFDAIWQALSELADRFPATEFVFPVHLNPNVRDRVGPWLSGKANVRLTAPASYPEFVWLMDRSKLIITDSGGVQEEAPSLRKPVLVTRETTERPEAVEAGAVQLVGADCRRIVSAAATLLTDPVAYANHQIDENPYGDGRAAERILAELAARNWPRQRRAA
jgi:UDP-N-acetylglucosamine 2-epimerase (non-hydrolysing)